MGLGSLAVRPAAAPAPAQTRAAGETIETILLDFRSRYGFTPWQASTYRGFLSVPAAWRASVMLSDLFAQMPFRSYRVDGEGDETPTPRNAMILDSPAGNVEDPAVVYASWAMDYLWDGNMVGIYTGYGQNGLPNAILPIPTSVVGVRWDPETTGGPLGELTGRRQYDVNGVIFDESRVFHVKGPCAPLSLRGLGVLETQLSALTLGAELERQAAAISLHGVPTGLLKSSNPDADPGDLAVAKAKWLTNQRDRTIQALGPNIDFEPLSWNPEELQLIEARKFSLTQYELMFGLPVGWLGGDSPAKSYANVESDAVNLIKFSALSGMVTRAESVFTRKALPRGQRAVAERDAVLASDTMTRYKSYQLATGNKAWMTSNEVRKTEKLKPIEGGDKLPTEAKASVPAPSGDPAPEGGDGNTSPEGGAE